MFESLVPYIKDRLTKHHELYSGQCKAEYWEENCAYALRQAGFGSDWSPDFNHGVGVDQTTDNNIRISNKGGKVLEDLSEMTISGSRLTKHKTISDKLEFLKTKHEDYILCLATNNDDWKETKKYYFVVIDSKKLNYSDQNWDELIGIRGKSKGKVTGWECTSEGFNAKIQRSMSDQLWTDISSSIFEEIHEITIL